MRCGYLSRVGMLSICSLFMAGPQYAAQAQMPATYQLVDLGTLGGTTSYGYNINNSTTIVGYSDTTSNVTSRGFHHTGASAISPFVDAIGTFKGPASAGYGINALGDITGYAQTQAGDSHAYRLYTSQGIFEDLGTLGGSISVAYSISDNNIVVGYSYISGNTSQRAFRHFGTGALTAADNLGTLGGTTSSSTGINPSGDTTVGYSTQAGDQSIRAFRHSGAGTISAATDDLGSFGGTNSFAVGVNNSKTVVGYAQIAGDAAYHAFRHIGTGAINAATDDLGTLGGTSSFALGLNTAGIVVGYLDDGFGNTTAFLYDTALHNLNSLLSAPAGWVVNYAQAINDKKQIVGTATAPNGDTHAVLLLPSGSTAGPTVPEPGAFAVMLTAAMLSILRLRKRTRK